MIWDRVEGWRVQRGEHVHQLKLELELKLKLELELKLELPRQKFKYEVWESLVSLHI